MNNPYLYPMGYQPYPNAYQQNAQQMPYQQSYQGIPQGSQIAQQSQSAKSNSITWVQGEAGAKSYLVAPNETVQLWDSESQTIYLKSADASGMPSLKVLDYTIREQNKTTSQNASECPNFESYVTKDELVQLEDRISKKVERMIQSQGDINE